MTAEERAQMTLSLLKSIDSSLKELVAQGKQKAKGDSVGAAIADDADLDSQYGDPVIRRDPKRWTGESYVGSKFSETTPEYLEEVASFKDWQAGKDAAAGDTKKAGYNRKDAARARGWAKRLREGYRPPLGAPQQQADFGDTDFDGGF